MDYEKAKKILKTKSAAVIGCGGLGGYVIECLARAGIGCLYVMDGDTFSDSNLNRQLFAKKGVLGKNKASVAKDRVGEISNSEVVVIPEKFREGNQNSLKNVDIIIDCVDNISSRLVLENYATISNKVLVHGAINGMQGQVTVVKPNSGIISKLYEGEVSFTGATICPTPMLVGAMEANEAIKVLTENGEPLYGKLLIIDLETNLFRILEIK